MGYQGKSTRPADAMGRQITGTEDKDYEEGGAQRDAGAPKAACPTCGGARGVPHRLLRKRKRRPPAPERSTREDRRIRKADEAVGRGAPDPEPDEQAERMRWMGGEAQ